MPDMSNSKTPMPELSPKERVKCFDEVALGYTAEMAAAEARRCLNCKHRPCVGGCPVGVPIPEFISELAEGRAGEAAEIIRSANMLPAICGRVCPQESQCEKLCVRGIKGEPVAIGRLERYAADAAPRQCASGKHPSSGKRVAVIGSGPSGLTCAGELARRGHAVTIFEALHKAGGVLVYGIPEFRLPKRIVEREIESLTALGVEIKTNVVVGKSVTVDELLDEGGFSAVFIGSGAGLPTFMGIEGEDLNGVYSANEFLTRVNLMKAYRDDSRTPIFRAEHVAVIGGGNVAMDAARCARRLGARVTIVYRRTEKELPARLEEIHHAKEEGIEFKMLTAPLKIEADEKGWVKSLLCEQMELGEPDASGRRRPVPVEGSEHSIDTQSVVIAIGNSPNPLISRTTGGLETNKWGCLVVRDESGLTTKDATYAGGDAVTGAATVILAMGAGKRAADAIDKYISAQ